MENLSSIPRPQLKTMFNCYLVIDDCLPFHGKIDKSDIADLGDWKLEEIKTIEVSNAFFTSDALKHYTTIEARLANVTEVKREETQGTKRERDYPEAPPTPCKKRTKRPLLNARR